MRLDYTCEKQHQYWCRLHKHYYTGEIVWYYPFYSGSRAATNLVFKCGGSSYSKFQDGSKNIPYCVSCKLSTVHFPSLRLPYPKHYTPVQNLSTLGLPITLIEYHGLSRARATMGNLRFLAVLLYQYRSGLCRIGGEESPAQIEPG